MWKSASASGSAVSSVEAASVLIVFFVANARARRLGLGRATDAPRRRCPRRRRRILFLKHGRTDHFGCPVADRERAQAHRFRSASARPAEGRQPLQRAVHVPVAPACGRSCIPSRPSTSSKCAADQDQPVVGERIDERRALFGLWAPASASARASAFAGSGAGAVVLPTSSSGATAVSPLGGAGATGVGSGTGAVRASQPLPSRASPPASSAGPRVPGC